MSRFSEREVVMRLLQTASAGQPPPAEGHISDDDELLTCWESGLITPSQREAILAHLAVCPQCRRALAEMIRRGDLELATPGTAPVFEDAAPQARSAKMGRSPSRWTVHRWAVLALSACLLVAVGIIGQTLWRPDASLGIPSHSALAMRGRVMDYGYLLDGQAVATKGPMFDTSLDRRQQELQQLLKAKPDDRDLRLDYGEVLLQQQQPADAAGVFQKMLESNPNDTAARLGLGLAQFQQEHLEDALQQFRAVLKSAADNITAKLDAAACLARLGRTAEAVRYWREVLMQTPDAELRSHIEQTIRLYAK